MAKLTKFMPLVGHEGYAVGIECYAAEISFFWDLCECGLVTDEMAGRMELCRGRLCRRPGCLEYVDKLAAIEHHFIALADDTGLHWHLLPRTTIGCNPWGRPGRKLRIWWRIDWDRAEHLLKTKKRLGLPDRTVDIKQLKPGKPLPARLNALDNEAGDWGLLPAPAANVLPASKKGRGKKRQNYDAQTP